MNQLKLYRICCPISRLIIRLLIIGVLTGCAGLPAKVPSGAVATGASVPSAAAPGPSKTPAGASLTLEPCMVGAKKAECGYLHVPEDRDHPEGRILDLKITVVRAYGTDRQPDPLFYIAGGPGVAATTVAGLANNLFNDVNAQRDIVFLDQRGTNDKHKLTCEMPTFNFNEATQQQVDDWVKQCLPKLDGDPRFLTTAVAMRDLDDARAALGYDKINLFGISYGAMAIQVYMRMFPGHFRAAVLDHGTALDLPFMYARARASQMALDQIFSYCDRDERCHTAFPDIRGDWQAVRDRLAKGPVVTSYQPAGAPKPASVTMNDIANGIHQLMYKSGTYTQVPLLIHNLATKEDWTEIVKSYSERYGSSAQSDGYSLMGDMIFCFEPAWGYDPEEISRSSSGTYLHDLMVQWAQNEQKLCKALPKPGRSLIYDSGKPAPLSALMLNSLIDPQNPPSNMDLALKEFTRSRVVVEPTEGHDTSASSCRWDMITQYIQQGGVEGLDTTCMQDQKPYFITGNAP